MQVSVAALANIFSPSQSSVCKHAGALKPRLRKTAAVENPKAGAGAAKGKRGDGRISPKEGSVRAVDPEGKAQIQTSRGNKSSEVNQAIFTGDFGRVEGPKSKETGGRLSSASEGPWQPRK